MLKRLIQTLAIILPLTVSSMVMGADFGAGVTAYVKGNYKVALSHFKPLAEQGLAQAQYNLGLMYRKGQGVPQNYQQAVYWYTKAAEQGFAQAQYTLGATYHQGQGVPQNYQQAIYWYTKAAKQGFARAQFGLGLMYGLGQGLPRDYTLAYMWATIAASNGAKNSEKLRDANARMMTQTDINQAKKMSNRCVASGYKNCGY